MKRWARWAWRHLRSQRRALQLTLEGWFLVAAMLLIGLAALNTGAPLLYLMFATLCAFFVLSALMATSTIRALELERELPHVWVAGRLLTGRVSVRNRKRLGASYSLRVRDLAEDGTALGATFFPRIGGRALATEEYQCVFLRRGVYRLARLELATRFPFGLIERRMSYAAPMEMLVLPQTIELERAMHAARTDLGEYDANVRGRGAGLYGLRVYTPDIPARDIHWKVSARRGTLIAREYESEEKRRASVILDNAVRPNQDVNDAALNEAFERAVVLAASAIEWLCLHDHDVELRTAGGVVGFGAGPSHVTRCRRALARLHLMAPTSADPHIFNPEPDIVHFPVVYTTSSWEAADGVVPLRVEDYEAELSKTLECVSTDADPNTPPKKF